MLRILLYSKIQKEIRYSAVEILEHIGVPFREIQDLEELDEKDASNVLIIPETAEVDLNTEEKIIDSLPSIIFIGYLPHKKICDKIGLVQKDFRVFEPPEISGAIRMNDEIFAPFFYGFPIVQTKEESFQPAGEIERMDEKFNGIVFRNTSRNTNVFIFPKLFKSTTYMFSGAEETLGELGRDLFCVSNRLDARKIAKYRKETLYVPIVNAYERLLLNIFKEISKKRRIPMVQKRLYPKAHRMAFCLSHDVDFIANVTRQDVVESFKKKKFVAGIARTILLASSTFRATISDIQPSSSNDLLDLVYRFITQGFSKYNPAWNFNDYCNIEDNFGVNSTYFFFSNSSEKGCDYECGWGFIKQIMKSLRERGREIGLHGSGQSHADKTQMALEKSSLENILKEKVIGVRQHLLMMHIPKTWRCQEESKFVYDTSLGFYQDVGFRAGTCLPFTPWDFEKGREFSIMEIPLIAQDVALFERASSQQGGVLETFRLCKTLIDTTFSYDGVFTLLWHTCISKVAKPYWMDTYYKILRYSSRYDPWYTNSSTLAKWWRSRTQVSITEDSTKGSEMEFCAKSSEDIDGFTVRVYLPEKRSCSRIFINERQLESQRIYGNGEEVTFAFNILKGSNKIKLRFQET